MINKLINLIDMKYLIYSVAAVLIFGLSTSCSTVEEAEISVVSQPTEGTIPLVSQAGAIPILIDDSDAEVVRIISEAVSSDIELITEQKPKVANSNDQLGEYAIIAGTIGKSKFIDQLISDGKLDVSVINGKWERYMLKTISSPFSGVKKALVIAGSDRRGTAYGLFELSRMAGVSPWVWWADVRPAPRKELYITEGTFISKEPSVKFRGIFLNDEDWGLQPWAAKNIDTDIQDIGPKTYGLIFELMLRLKANFIWPAMHDSTKPFFYYDGNAEMADKYAIVIGSTHCDQMLRSNTYEWQKNFENEYGVEPGPYQYDVNKKQVFRYWDDRVNETQNFESIYTIGMRGVRDGSIQGPQTIEDKIALMDTIMADQRGIFDKYFGDVTQVPQLFCPYKEVLELYQNGLKIPEDVTLIWTDDNYGYLRQLSSSEEQQRSGSSGIYYHLSYMGRPHDYLWLSSTSPSLVGYEMTKAYQFGADRLWVVNVGDIKPSELETQFFLDMAWDMDQWNVLNANEYAVQWASDIFGSDLGQQIGKIKSDYYALCQAGKPEHQRIIRYDQRTRDERLETSLLLIEQVESVKQQIPDYLQDAFFELVEYPTKGAALMNMKMIYGAMSREIAESDREKSRLYSVKTKEAYYTIQELARHYAEEIQNGKWNGMITASPRNTEVFGMPRVGVPEVIEDQSLYEQKFQYAYTARDTFDIGIEKGLVSITADEYHSKNDQIITIPGLGLGGKSISRYPFNGQSFDEERFKNAPNVIYKFSLDAGAYQLSIKCLPTRYINAERSLKLAVVIEEGEPVFLDVHYDRYDELWKTNVLRGFIPLETSLTVQEKGEISVKIYIMDTGLAISRLDVMENQ